jgi:hypothetical protein
LKVTLTLPFFISYRVRARRPFAFDHLRYRERADIHHGR